MGYIDRTQEFRLLCSQHPPAKRRKVSKHDGPTAEEVAAKAYVAEGYNILKHINTLNTLLQSVRRPYLNVEAQPSYNRQARNIDLSAVLAGRTDAFASIKSLTNEERDQIDLQARMILGKCADRVKDMELLEKRRQDVAAAQANPLARLLPARLLGGDTAAADFVAAHRTNITWYLTRRLADASEIQKGIQEERIKRQSERAKTLGSSAAMYEADMIKNATTRRSSWGMGGMAPSPASGLASAITGSLMGRRGTMSPVQRPTSPPLYEDSDEEEDLELTPGQILQFEQENAEILRSVENTLAAVKLAESRLLDISALQTELIVQLTRQSEMVDQLYDEAITSQGEVEKGHVQLKQARERAKESRKWLLVFILGATAAMLFLHWYD
ncbi:hypothetical protein M407DRAFT_215627 [Tulasnella calospora MUT 4182]|uniref:t-SNARE coiled-coil homology domain-containing protein n=1 Tax=Tulasnella calospora MUT 4182 TaxID=1051891 RepID=A0A0C3Q311_9AGAM|nr:hypothetical protein M407DRAFT_215627 [Tulasnella calospora MUT 4182]